MLEAGWGQYLKPKHTRRLALAVRFPSDLRHDGRIAVFDRSYSAEVLASATANDVRMALDSRCGQFRDEIPAEAR